MNKLTGNKRFRDVVALHRPDYVRAPKVQKPSVARVIVRAIRNGDPPGRFLKKDKNTGLWYDIGDKKAAEKTSQALREKQAGGERQSKEVTTSIGATSHTLVLPNNENHEVSNQSEAATTTSRTSNALEIEGGENMDDSGTQSPSMMDSQVMDV